MLALADIVETLFTTPNPETGGSPPEHICWAIFANGTVFLALPGALSLEASVEEIQEAAVAALEELGPPITGTSSADFSISRVSWYPDDWVYMVTYDHNAIVNFVQMEEETEGFVVGLKGRITRSDDLEEPRITLVRTFAGETLLLQEPTEGEDAPQ